MPIPLIIGLLLIACYARCMWIMLVSRPTWTETFNWKTGLLYVLTAVFFVSGMTIIGTK